VALGGTNDLSVESPENIAGNMKLIAQKAKAQGFAHVFLCTIPIFPNVQRFPVILSKLRQTNELLNLSGFPIVPLQDACSVDDASLWDDGLHNTPMGYKQMGKVVEKELLNIKQ